MIAAASTAAFAAAYYTDTSKSQSNFFMLGSFNLQVAAATDGEPIWYDYMGSIWESQYNWQPSQTLDGGVLIRNFGNTDAGSVTFSLKQVAEYRLLPDKIELVEAWYDQNASGDFQPEEEITTALHEAYNSNDQTLTMRELTEGSTNVPFELENNTVLPGLVTNPEVGGANGRGKELHLKFGLLEYDMSNQNDQVQFDVIITASQI